MNAPLPMLLTPLPMLTRDSIRHPLNALLPMLSTLAGSDIDVSWLQ